LKIDVNETMKKTWALYFVILPITSGRHLYCKTRLSSAHSSVGCRKMAEQNLTVSDIAGLYDLWL